MFLSSLLISTLISISSNSWLGMWLGLEINLLSIIPLMNNISNSYSSEASIKYFITQALSSAIMLMSMILMIKLNNMIFIKLITPVNLMFNSAILTKMGAAPFHFWFPEIMEGLNWMNCLLMLTWQKINPMILLSYNFNMNFLSMIIILCMIISSFMMMNQTSLRKILTYSSISHMSWMLTSLMMETMWFYYFLIYSLITIMLIYMFNYLNLFFLKQLFNFSTKNTFTNLTVMMNFMSMGGLPPFLGFFPKWIIIQSMINYKMIILTYFMISMNLMILFTYLRMMFPPMILNMNSINYLKINNKIPKNMIMLNLINLSSLMFCTLTFNFS
uniref:NADH-ubiquinone oxidoreductase chain 2 n=1 Tax=Lucifotychus sp. 1 EF-2015 TaxID=1756870 RepID=A0A0S2M7J9_9COLE|nr:NADH deshydrogenase subunit 2 [Lucifotychus sp. 1 EF-2015]